MFTLEQIKAAHSNVKSGADFPVYIRDIKKLGVIYYEVHVNDGHTEYFGTMQYKVFSAATYDVLNIAENLSINQFKSDLIAHQQGKTDYMSFCSDCAKSGIERWKVNLESMTCTYFDKAGNEILIENIPQ
jgi:uncharacterized protein YbcV (DUF1398 family)